jgi:hypothetical protein
MRTTLKRGIVCSIILATVLFLFVAGCGPFAGLPEEASNSAMSSNLIEVINDFQAAAPGDSNSRARIDASARANRLITKSESAPLTPNEKNDGYTDAWCVKLKVTTNWPGTDRPFAVDYAYLVTRRLNKWSSVLEAKWPDGTPETSEMKRCSLKTG